jgi:hypothetical protein
MNDNQKNEEPIVIFNKHDCKMTRLKTNSYQFQYEISNERILLEKIFNLEFIKLVYEINKQDIFDDFNLDIHDETCATVYILFKHFFGDFGFAQKFAHLDITIEKTENRILFTSETNYTNPSNITLIPTTELLPISNATAVCNFVNPHKVSIVTTLNFNYNIDLPEFVEKLATTIISKVFLRTKQFIEKM